MKKDDGKNVRSKEQRQDIASWLEDIIPGIGANEVLNVDPESDILSLKDLRIYNQVLIKAIRTVSIKLAETIGDYEAAYNKYKAKYNEIFYLVDKKPLSYGDFTNLVEGLDGTKGINPKITDKAREALTTNILNYMIEEGKISDRYILERRKMILEEAKYCLINLASRCDSLYNIESLESKKSKE